MRAKHVVAHGGAHYGLRFHCPGCDEEHVITTKPHAEPAWDFDGDYAMPTISPSIHVHPHKTLRDDGSVGETFRCHSFVKAGRIQFLHDSTHKLAGQTVDLPELVETEPGLLP